MSNYYKKTEYVEAITQHLAKEGKRMTNLKKASLEQLHALAIDKYNIDMIQFHSCRKTEMKLKTKDNKEQKEREARERRQREEAYQKQKQEDENKINDFKRTTNMDLNIIKNKWVVHEQFKDKQYFKDNKEKLEKENKDADDWLNRMAKELNGEVNEKGIMANGVQVDCLGLYSYIEKSEKQLRKMYDENKTILMLSNLNIHEDINYDSDESELVISSDSDDE